MLQMTMMMMVGCGHDSFGVLVRGGWFVMVMVVVVVVVIRIKVMMAVDDCYYGA